MSGLLGKSHAELLDMRFSNRDPKFQAEVAPYEHRAFAREKVRESPINALGLLGAIPAYQLAKLLGLVETDERSTPPSLEQMKHGFAGIYEGLIGK